MERTYTTGRGRAGHDAGDPVLLTPYIEGKKLEEGRKAAYVDPDYTLPDMDSYAGYLTVSEYVLVFFPDHSIVLSTRSTRFDFIWQIG